LGRGFVQNNFFFAGKGEEEGRTLSSQRGVRGLLFSL